MDWLDDKLIDELAGARSPLLARLGLRFHRTRRDWEMLASAGMLDCIPIGSAWNGDRLVARVEADGSISQAPLCVANTNTGATEILAADGRGFVRSYSIFRLILAEPNLWRAIHDAPDDQWQQLERIESLLGGEGDLSATREMTDTYRERLGAGSSGRQESYAEAQLAHCAGLPRHAFHGFVAALRANENPVPSASALKAFYPVSVALAARHKKHADPDARLRYALEATTAPWQHDATWSGVHFFGRSAEPIASKRPLTGAISQFLSKQDSWDRDQHPAARAVELGLGAGWDTYDGLAHAAAARELTERGDYAGSARAILTTVFWVWARTGEVQSSSLELLAGVAEKGQLSGLSKTLTRMVDTVHRSAAAAPTAVSESQFGLERLQAVISGRDIGMTTWSEDALVELETSGAFRFPDEWRGFLLQHGHPKVTPNYRSGELNLDPKLVAEFHQENPATVQQGRVALGYVEGTGHTVQQDIRTGQVTHRDRSRFDWIADDTDGFCEQLALWLER